MAHQDDAKGSTGLSLIAVRAGFLQDACKDQWEEGWSQALLRDGLNLARQGIRVNDLQPQSSLPLPYVFCPLLTYQCICCRVSSKSFCLWGLKKNLPCGCPITSEIHYLHSNWLQERKAHTHVHACDNDSFKGCWESNLTRIWYTQQHITKGFTVKTFIAKWSLRTKESKEKFTSKWNVWHQLGFLNTLCTLCWNIKFQRWSQ